MVLSKEGRCCIFNVFSCWYRSFSRDMRHEVDAEPWAINPSVMQATCNWNTGFSPVISRVRLLLFLLQALKGSGVWSSEWVGDRTDNSCWPSHVRNLSRILFKYDKDIHRPKISEEFDYGKCAPSNMRIINLWMTMSRSILAFLGSFFKVN